MAGVGALWRSWVTRVLRVFNLVKRPLDDGRRERSVRDRGGRWGRVLDRIKLRDAPRAVSASQHNCRLRHVVYISIVAGRTSSRRWRNALLATAEASMATAAARALA